MSLSPQVLRIGIFMHISSPPVRMMGHIQSRITCFGRKITNPDVTGAGDMQVSTKNRSLSIQVLVKELFHYLVG